MGNGILLRICIPDRMRTALGGSRTAMKIKKVFGGQHYLLCLSVYIHAHTYLGTVLEVLHIPVQNERLSPLFQCASGLGHPSAHLV